MHKHFRMISIHADMRSHGFATDDAPHTRIPGIWRKLNQLYDLRALDERENAYAFADEPDPLDREEAAELPEFELPEDEFGEMMWLRRFHGPDSEASSSPPLMPTEDDKLLYEPGNGLLKDLPDGPLSQQIEKEQQEESAAEATPPPKNAKNARASRAAAKGGKGAKAQAAKNSKAQSAVSDSAEEDGEDDDEDEEDESSSQSEDVAPSTRRTNRAKGKPQPVPKRTRKR